jgi:hypothetical protein
MANANDLNNFKANLEGVIAEIIKGEATLSKLLATASRDLLAYVPETGDIGMVNRLLEGLSKANRNHAFVFFKTFLQWDVSEAGLFTSKMTGKRKSLNIESERAKFLANAENDLWTWEKARRVMPVRTDAEKRETAVKRITNDIKKGLTEIKLSPADILHIIAEAGVTIEEIVRLADVMKSEAETTEKKLPPATPKANPTAKPKVDKPKANVVAKRKQAAQVPALN